MVTLMNESPGYESLMIKYDLNDAQDLNIEWTKVSCEVQWLSGCWIVYPLDWRIEIYKFVIIGHLWLYGS